MVFTVSHRKRIVTGVTDWGSEFATWWSGTASINLSVILSRRWSLNTGCHSGQPLFTWPWLCLWETLILPPPVFSVPFAPSPAFISTLQAVPFQSIISSTPTLALGEGGKEGSMLRGVEFFYRSWHPWRSVTRHFALSFTLFFLPPQLFPLKLPSSTSFMKSHSSLPSKPVSFSGLFLVFSLVCPCTLLPSWVSCWSSGSGRASLRTQTMKGQELNEEKGMRVGVGERVCLPSMHACTYVVWEMKDKIGLSHLRVWLGGHNR